MADKEVRGVCVLLFLILSKAFFMLVCAGRQKVRGVGVLGLLEAHRQLPAQPWQAQVHRQAPATEQHADAGQSICVSSAASIAIYVGCVGLATDLISNAQTYQYIKTLGSSNAACKYWVLALMGILLALSVN